MVTWAYSETRSGSHGTMCCTVCQKQITEGRYRYRQKSRRGDWGYVAQHEACAPEDGQWAWMDQLAARHQARRVELSNACREFRAKWGVTELDDYIIEAAP